MSSDEKLEYGSCKYKLVGQFEFEKFILRFSVVLNLLFRSSDYHHASF